MATEINNLMANLAKYKFNASGIQRVMLQHLADITDGKINVVDPTNPFVFLMESAAVNTANFMIQNEVNTRKQYPAAAQTPEDVYIHMSDVDFVDRFAVPAVTKFSIIFKKDELLESLIYDPASNSRKITIPRNTQFTVADTAFSMQYPVDIKQLSHGGLQIVYDTDVKSPLFDLTSNLIEWSVRTDTQNKEDWIYIEVDAHQFKVDSFIDDVTVSTGFNKSFDFEDSFYYTRVYNKSNLTNGQWVEIATTHTDQVYDINTPTAVLKVVDSVLTVTIPQIYLNTTQIRGAIRTDIYQTKGAVNLVLQNYKQNSFETTWQNIDSGDDTSYTAVIPTMRTVFAYSSKTVNGGRAALTFEELRKRVINNSIGPQQLPITNVQLESFLSNRGYAVVRNVDVVTNRILLASRSMPTPVDQKLITAGNSSIETFISSINSLSKHPAVHNNGSRVTIPSDLVFINNNGIISLLSGEEQASVSALSNEQMVQEINNKKYLYNPFHYVLDSSKNEFELRCYYLNSPVVKSISFVSQNDSTNLQINTVGYNVTKLNNAYKVQVTTVANDLVMDLDDDFVVAQLSFVSEGSNIRCSVNATVTRNQAGQRIFEFLLQSNFDIDEKNQLLFNAFQFFDLNNRNAATALTTKFDLTYSIKNSLDIDWTGSDVDEYLNLATIDPDALGLNHEVLEIQFGQNLKNLWSRSRSVFQDAPYRLHNTDSIKTYTEDIYAIDPVTSAIFSFNAQGEIIYNKLHSVGEVVLDENAQPVYNHRVGDVILDENGKPIPEDPTNIVRQMDLLFIDAVYYFANDVTSGKYRQQMIDSVVEWVVNELAEYESRALEQTKIYFYPKTNLGDIKVMVDNSIITNIDANQVFSIQLYVSNKVFINPDLRKFLANATVRQIDTLLNEPILSISRFITSLKEIYGDDVISISFNGLGGNNQNQTISILTEGDRCSIRKKLTALPNGDRIVEEDVNIAFIKHELDN